MKKFIISTIQVQDKIQVPALDVVKQDIMHFIHNHLSAGHLGRDETLCKTQEHYHWPNMKEWIANYVKGCATCKQNKILTHQTKVLSYCIPTEPDA